MEDQLKEALSKIDASICPVTIGFEIRRDFGGKVKCEYRGYSMRTATIWRGTLGEIVSEIQNASDLSGVMREIKETGEKLARLWQEADKLKGATQ